MSEKTIVIVGAGAAGCMAAIAAARSNPKARVQLMDGNEEVGKKILATGNGRCNYTNDYDAITCYHSDDMEGVAAAFGLFSKEDTVQFFRELGVLPNIKNGYYYPMSNQAVSIRDALLMELQQLGVSLLLGLRVIGVEATDNGFLVHTKEADYPADACIITTGGKAAPLTGSDGSGFSFAERLGHTVVKPVPSLVPLSCKKHPLRDAAGVRVNAKVSTTDPEGVPYADTGELQITKQGISGIPVFQISSAVARCLSQGVTATVAIDFWPNATEDEIASFITERREHGAKDAMSIFNGVFPHPLIQTLFASVGDGATVEALTSAIKEVSVEISQTQGCASAQTTSGGVKLLELDHTTMESSLHQGLYFAGEIVDVDGICGGYNLQWAWTSGYLAGQHAAQELL